MIHVQMVAVDQDHILINVLIAKKIMKLQETLFASADSFYNSYLFTQYNGLCRSLDYISGTLQCMKCPNNNCREGQYSSTCYDCYENGNGTLDCLCQDSNGILSKERTTFTGTCSGYHINLNSKLYCPT